MTVGVDSASAETLRNAARRDAPISLSEGPGRLGRAGGAISEAMALGRWSWSDLLHLRVRVVFRAIKATQGGEARVRSSKRFSERNAEVTGTISTDAACIRAKFHQRSPHSCNLVALVAPSANTRKSSNFCKARPLRAEHRLRAAEPAARQHRPKALHVTLSHKPPHTEASLAPMAPPPDKRPTTARAPPSRAAPSLPEESSGAASRSRAARADTAARACFTSLNLAPEASSIAHRTASSALASLLRLRGQF